jgi:hypothetical protein
LGRLELYWEHLAVSANKCQSRSQAFSYNHVAHAATPVDRASSYTGALPACRWSLKSSAM